MTHSSSRFLCAGLMTVAAWALTIPAVAQQAGSSGSTPSEVSPAPAAATRNPDYLEGRFLVGANWGPMITTNDDLDNVWKVSPFFRTVSHRSGWGPSFGLNWIKPELKVAVGGVPTTVGVLRVRPLMAGIGYNRFFGRLRASAGLVAGYAFTRAILNSALPTGVTADLSIGRVWTGGPKLGFTYALTHRFALVSSASFVWARPNVTAHVWRDGALIYSRQGALRADAFTLRVGAAASLF